MQGRRVCVYYFYPQLKTHVKRANAEKGKPNTDVSLIQIFNEFYLNINSQITNTIYINVYKYTLQL